MAFQLDDPIYSATLSTIPLAYIITMVGSGPPGSNKYDETVHGEAGVAHDYTDFDTYFKLTIISLSGNYSYVMYTAAGTGVDEVILPPSDGSFTNILNPTVDGSDVYNCVHIAVPTWKTAIAYTLTANHHVYYAVTGLVYKCIQNVTGAFEIPTDTAYWSPVDDDDINAKYRADINLAYVVPLESDYATMGVDVVGAGVVMHRKDLLANIDFQKASKLWVMLESVDNLTGRGLWANVADIIAYAKLLTGE